MVSVSTSPTITVSQATQTDPIEVCPIPPAVSLPSNKRGTTGGGISRRRSTKILPSGSRNDKTSTTAPLKDDGNYYRSSSMVNATEDESSAAIDIVPGGIIDGIEGIRDGHTSKTVVHSPSSEESGRRESSLRANIRQSIRGYHRRYKYFSL